MTDSILIFLLLTLNIPGGYFLKFRAIYFIPAKMKRINTSKINIFDFSMLGFWPLLSGNTRRVKYGIFVLGKENRH